MTPNCSDQQGTCRASTHLIANPDGAKCPSTLACSEGVGESSGAGDGAGDGVGAGDGAGAGTGAGDGDITYCEEDGR